jgi:23S rRNA (guanosine2251-2'-O)-methyltransferase
MTGSTQDTLLVGQIAVEAALYAGQREVRALCVDEALDHRKVEPLRRLARSAGVAWQKLPREELDEQAGEAKHGGVVGRFGPRPSVGMDELFEASDGEPALVVMLDGIEDPYNFAHAVRALWAAGATGLVVRPRNWYDAAALIGRASAGATELIPTAVADTPLDALTVFRANGFRVIAAGATRDAVVMHEADLTGRLFLMLGGEHRGIQKPALRQADAVVRVPYARPFDMSLGTVAAAAVIAFEAARQRSA